MSNLFFIIASSLSILVSLVVFILKIISYKKTEYKSLFDIIGCAILFIGTAVALVLSSIQILALTLLLFTLCFLAQAIINLVNAKLDRIESENSTESFSYEKTDFPAASQNADVSSEIVKIGRTYLSQAAECLSEESNLEKLLTYINKSIIEKTNADGGMILLLDDFEDVLFVKSLEGSFPPPFKLDDDIPHKELRVTTTMRHAKFNMEDNIFGKTVSECKAELIKDAQNDSRVFQAYDEDFLKASSYIFVPIKIGETTAGVIALARKIGKEPFTANDFNVAQSLTNFAGSATNVVYVFNLIQEHEMLTKDATLAGELQKKIQPKKLPNIQGLSIGSYFSSSKGICGDYYDIIPSRKDRISFILADIAGKGINSFIIMLMLRAILRLIVNTKQSPSTILEWTNKGISSETSVEHFASLVLINYDSIAKKVQYSTAGTTPIYYYNAANKEVTKISQMSEPIGIEKNQTYVTQEMDVSDGDIIFTFTDGLIESINDQGQPYTVQRLTKLVTDNCQLSGKELADLVKSEVRSFMGNTYQHDDQTLLVIKIQ